ncbi:hypothetical protein ACFLUO_09750 [Chloroflexota bacterium]
MLDELFPVQFVEGINEEAELPDEKVIVITSYSGIGLQYVPKVSYSLTKLEVVLTFSDIPQGAKIRIDLNSDYNGKPTNDIILSTGSIIPEGVGGWQQVNLQPVSLIKGRKYWVTIHPNGCPVALIKTEKGKSVTLSVKAEDRWATPTEDIRGKVMLRFYGRIFPTSD